MALDWTAAPEWLNGNAESIQLWKACQDAVDTWKVFGTRTDLDRSEKGGQRFDGRSRSPVVTRTRQILEEAVVHVKQHENCQKTLLLVNKC